MVINLTADAKAIKEQEAALKARREKIESRVESIKRYLEYATDGNAFASPRVQVKFTRSKKAEITNEVLFWENPAEMFIRRSEPVANIAAIRKALMDGGIVPGAELVEHSNITIK